MKLYQFLWAFFIALIIVYLVHAQVINFAIPLPGMSVDPGTPNDSSIKNLGYLECLLIFIIIFSSVMAWFSWKVEKKEKLKDNIHPSWKIRDFVEGRNGS